MTRRSEGVYCRELDEIDDFPEFSEVGESSSEFEADFDREEALDEVDFAFDECVVLEVFLDRML